MTFLQPFILWGLPLILLPVIIHLINRMRHRPQPWAAMRFLLAATRASTSHAKLRQFLILLFRTLAVLMLLLFLARPLAGGWMGWMLSSAPDVVLILLDRSASMETRIDANTTKRQQALKLISEAAKQFEGASRFVLIDSALRSPQEIVSPSSLTDSSLAAATDTAADVPAMLQAAFNYLLENRAGSAEVWIASDLQQSNWQTEDGRLKNVISQLNSLPQKVRVRLLAMNQPVDRNVSVSLQEVTRRPRGSGGELQFVAEFQNHASASETVPLETVLNGASSEIQVIVDSQAMRWRHKLDVDGNAKSGWGSFRLPADANLQDNTTYFVYGGDIPLRSTVVNSNPESGTFFKVAASVVARSKETVQQLAPDAFNEAELEDRSLLVWQAPLPSGEAAERIENFVREGGIALFVPPGAPNSQSFLGITWGDIESSEDEKGFPVLKWNQEDGPLAKSDEGFSLPLPQTEFKKRQVINGEKTVVAAFDDGVPFLARQTVGKGQAYFCASLPEETWSTLGEGPVLVPMMQRLLHAGSKRLQPVAIVNCGELSLADMQRQWSPVDNSMQRDVRLNAGVYRSGDRLIALNRPATEDEPGTLDISEATGLFSGMAFQMLQDRQARADALQGEIWRFFLFGMLAFLVGESLLILPGKAAQKPAAVNAKAEVAA